MGRNLENDEADLNALFASLGRGRDNFMAFLYGMVLIAKKLWIVLLLVIIAGVALGYYKEHYGAKKYQTTLVVQTNQKSTEVVYDLVENAHSYYLEGFGFAPYEVLEMEMEAIPNFKDLLDQYENQNINLIEYLLENASADDVLRAEFFRDSYRFHKIDVEFGYTLNENSIDNVINLLNGIENYKEINTLYSDFNARKVAEFEKMLTQIDETIEKYNSNSGGDQNVAVTGINVRESNFVTSLVEYKSYALRFLENAKYDEVTGDKNVYLVNSPVIRTKSPLLPYIILFPLIAIILFYLAVYFLRLLARGKVIHEQKRA